MICKKMSLRHMIPFEVLLISYMILVLFFSFATCDNGIDKDKEKCANQLVGLATCISYVSGSANAPPIDCCTGLRQVMQKSPECVCLLVKDRNDPSLGLQINATRALSLPTLCNSPGNVSDCPALLHLSPNSPDAKVFDDFANIGKKSNTTATAPAAASAAKSSNLNGRVGAADQNSDGGERWSKILVPAGVLLTIAALHHNLFNI